MAILFVDDATTAPFWNSSGTVAVPITSTSYSAGNVAVAIVYAGIGGGSQASAPTITESWTIERYDNTTTADDRFGLVAYKVLSGSESNPAVDLNLTSSVNTRVWVGVYSGVDKSTPMDTAATQGVATTDNTPPQPSITTVTDGARVIASLLYTAPTGDFTSASPFSGYTERRDIAVNTRNFVLNDLDKTSAGIESPGNWSFTGTNNHDSMMYAIALRPGSRRIFIT
jgi:hypothetical protein